MSTRPNSQMHRPPPRYPTFALPWERNRNSRRVPKFNQQNLVMSTHLIQFPFLLEMKNTRSSTFDFSSLYWFGLPINQELPTLLSPRSSNVWKSVKAVQIVSPDIIELAELRQSSKPFCLANLINWIRKPLLERTIFLLVFKCFMTSIRFICLSIKIYAAQINALLFIPIAQWTNTLPLLSLASSMNDLALGKCCNIS